MRLLSFFLFICVGLTTNAYAQGGVDVTKAKANPKTFIFDDDKHTVHGYLYATLKEQTSCCGNDAIYLEVKFDQSGIVTSAKTLTGKNDCYKKSVVDIVKNVRWDATGVNGSKTIYFEVKPIIPCSGSPGENTYQAIAGVVNSGSDIETSSVSDAVEEEIEEEVEEVVAEVEEEMIEEVEEIVEEEVEEAVEEMEEEIVEEVVEEVEEVVAEVEEEEEESSWSGSTDDFLSDGGVSDPVEESSSDNNVSTDNATTMTGGAQKAAKYTGPVKIPPQADLEYVSKGERSPTEDHRETFANVPGERISNPRYKEGETQLARKIRQELSKTGYCGLAQAAFELTIDPQGNVVETRLLAVNNEKIRESVPGIINTVKFQPAGYASNYRSYHQFKAFFRCGEETPSVDLEAIPNMIEPVADNN